MTAYDIYSNLQQPISLHATTVEETILVRISVTDKDWVRMSGFISEPERSHEHRHISPNKRYGVAEEAYAGRQGKSSADTPRDPEVVQDEEQRSDDIEISAAQKMLSAVSGSLLTSLLVTPLDVVRVRLQSQAPLKASSLPRSGLVPNFANLPSNLGVTACCREVFWVNNTSPFCIAGSTPSVTTSSTFTALNPSLSSAATPDTAADCAVDASRQKSFNSTFDGLRKIARNEGAFSLWRGLSPTLLMAIPANVIYFTGYDSLRSNPRSPIYKYVPDNYAPLIAGSMARIAAASVISPIEMFRTRMQAATGKKLGVFAETFDGLKIMVRAEGIPSLWRGLTLTMWRDVPFSGIYWWGYEAMRNALSAARESTHLREHGRPRSKTQEQNHTSTFVDSFVAGAISGAVASVVTTPFDVGKTRQQVVERGSSKNHKMTGAPKRPEDLSMPRFLYQIFKDEGLAGLFRGWAARCLKVAPACAIMISSYELGKKMAMRVNERHRDAAAAED